MVAVRSFDSPPPPGQTRLVHALRTGFTLCGVDASSMTHLPLVWFDEIFPEGRCPECHEASIRRPATEPSEDDPLPAA